MDYNFSLLIWYTCIELKQDFVLDCWILILGLLGSLPLIMPRKKNSKMSAARKKARAFQQMDDGETSVQSTDLSETVYAMSDDSFDDCLINASDDRNSE